MQLGENHKMSDHFDIISFLGNDKSVTATSFIMIIYSFFQYNDWHLIDSWSEVGIIVGIVITVINFCLGLYDKYWRKKTKRRN